MLNFTGSLKKRVVNLGDKKNNRNKNFLEQVRLDRIKREESRQRERCVLVIQSYLRRRVELLKKSDEFMLEWIRGSISTYWPVWTAQFAFVVKYGRKTDSLNILGQLQHKISESENQLDERSSHILIGALVEVLRRFPRSVELLQCFSALVQMYGILEKYTDKYRGVIDALGGFHGSAAEDKAVRLLFKINKVDSLLLFLKFVAFYELDENYQFWQTLQGLILEPNSPETISALLNMEKIQLLINTLRLKLPPYSATDYQVHAIILSTMNFSVRAHKDDIDDDLVLEAKDDLSNEKGNKELYVSQEIMDQLRILYSSEYVTSAFEELNTGSSKLAVGFVSLLMFLFPDARTKLCMMMTIIPGLDHWMFDELRKHQIYVEFKTVGEKLDYLSAESFSQIISLANFSQFLNLLHTYEQLLSYWLIVSNDIEQTRFSAEDLLDFSHFLRVFCLTLIFRNNEIQSVLKRLHDVSILLLNQLYIRNLRTHYLPRNFWQLKHLKFEIDNMIHIILDEEEKDDFSLDEEEVRRPSFSSKSKHKTPEMAAKLQVLTKAPFFVDFTDRVKVFQSLIDADQEKLESRQSWTLFSDPQALKLAADIYRQSILESSFERFHKTGSQFKHKLQVTFHNEHGVEAGIDGGGLTKEFLTSVVNEGFNPKNELELFKETSGNELFPNDDIYLKILKKVDLPEQQLRLEYMRFLGMIVGKCIYESVLIDVAFAPFFLNKWRIAQSTMKNSINDLKYLDLALYSNLNKLLTMSENQISQLDLDFTINENISGETFQYDLLPPNGDKTEVTAANRLNYIHQIANFKLNHSLQIQTKYFLQGLFDLIKPTWLNMFDPFELQMLISGGNDIDIRDWKENVLYGGYFDDDLTVTLFWEVVEEMSPQERCDLVKFVTSVSRAPLLGFGALSPKFGIHNSGPSDRLPTASTCVNLLKLPDYKDKEKIRNKLIFLISANSGFDLS